MRVVGGRFRGRPLAGPRSDAIRPTSDRMRESLFNILAHAFDLPNETTRVLDLFAGTGALGLEALSRGAQSALFMETGVEARALIRRNIEALGLTGAARIFRRDATKPGSAGTIPPFDLVFCDPPYRKGLGEKALAAVRAGGWLKADALCVLEEASDAEFGVPEGFYEVDRREAGETQLLFLRIR
ncbi:MAG TPA: 16S rRNA (guanine(966)-N(2))-methyltransferase RsmD [Afifellaceae bacterium]|nr:16S rRNA (guanine(966)-N(2))-methyltransferase RsmD [Afifellaceae bacterium]